MLLYHYCSPSAFYEIVTNRAVWLSALKQSNDHKEGLLVTASLARLAKSDGLDPRDADRMRHLIQLMQEIEGGLALCLSEEGDLLSQWRAYAGDGRGVAIGFHKEYLSRLSERCKDSPESISALLPVAYDTAAHDDLVRPTYDLMRTELSRSITAMADEPAALLQNSHGLSRLDIQVNRALHLAGLPLRALFYRLKGSAFREEREWRLVANHSLYASEQGCLYRATSDALIPFRPLQLEPTLGPPIGEIVLGPRHTSPDKVVQNFLRDAGFGDTQVRRSEATYR